MIHSPNVLADGDANAFALPIDDLVMICRFEITALVEDIVGG